MARKPRNFKLKRMVSTKTARTGYQYAATKTAKENLPKKNDRGGIIL